MSLAYDGDAAAHRLYACRDRWIALAARSAADALDALRAHAVPAAPVLPQGEFRTDPWLTAHRMFVRVDDPDFGACTVLRGYARWSGWEGRAAAPAPPAGRDTHAVLAEAGLTEQQITALLAAGAAEEQPTGERRPG